MTTRPAIIRLAIIQAVMFAAIGVGLWLSFPAWRLGQTSDRLRRDFPDVPQITPADLAGWRTSGATDWPVLIDVRTQKEFDFSHLIEARRVEAEGELPGGVFPEDPKRVIVVTCSTGERSTPFARRLLQSGFQRVFVLEGGLVRWANEGRPLTNDHELVTRVYGDAEVERLLKRAHRSIPPAAH